MVNRLRTYALVAGAVVAMSSPAWGLINKRFTPIHLTGEAQLILKLRPVGKPADGKIQLKVVEALKGKASGEITLRLDSAFKEHLAAVKELMAASAGEEMLLFAGRYPDENERMADRGFLHVQGRWLALAADKAGGWSVVQVDDWMNTIWNGGTDMLERCVRYILAEGANADVPVESGTGWRTVAKVGQVPGKVRGVRAVDLGDGKCTVYVASTAGDRLLRATGDAESEFEDITAARKLAAKSVLAAWGDFNGDGRGDLASWDGKGLRIHLQRADGTFLGGAEAEKTLLAIGPGSSLAVIGSGDRSALVLAGPEGMAVQKFTGGVVSGARYLDKAGAGLGKARRVLVGDFNNDSFPDILVAGETGGVLYAGEADGTFAASACAVHCTKGGGVAEVGDFDGDGRLDVLVAGSEGVRIWHNLPDGTFAERLGLSGEVSYKAQPFASGFGVCDFNNDSRQDIFITYGDQQALMYFNRGFRSFGEAPMLEGGLRERGCENIDAGQQGGTFADVNGDGAQDFVFVLTGGELWCACNDLGGDALAMRLRLKAPAAGPVTATVSRGKRCLGAVVVRRDRPGFMGIEEAGEFTVTWQMPGGKVQSRKVIVEEGAADVAIGKDK